MSEITTEVPVAGQKPRIKFLIYPDFQLKLILVNCTIMAFAFALIGIQSARSIMRLRDLGTSIHLPPDHPYFRFLEMQNSVFYSHLALAFVFSFCLSCAFTLILSHRLAGPIVRLRNYLNAIAEKREPEGDLNFRKKDFFLDLAVAVNGAVKTLKSQK